MNNMQFNREMNNIIASNMKKGGIASLVMSQLNC